MTPTPTEQRPQEREHWNRGRCRISIKAVYRPRRVTPDFVKEYCRGICHKFTPKTEKQ